MILALDLALTTGIAFDKPAVSSGVWNLRSEDDPSPASNRSIGPSIRLTEKLDYWHNRYHLHKVVFESAFSRHGPAAWIQMSLQTTVMMWCHRHGVVWSRWRPSEWKLAMLGKGRGNCSAEYYHHQARERWPELSIQTDDEAAALWLLEMERVHR